MNEQMMFFVGSSAYAALMAIGTVLSRSGIWRSWMKPIYASYCDERMILMFAPLSGTSSFGFALMTFPSEHPLFLLIGAILFVVPLLPLMPVTMFTRRKPPRWVYPKWAHQLLDERHSSQ